ncbi:hypothetical protein SNE40_018048 [Patella caerulea]|uniref:DnaJ homolog subfamily C member 1 n=1 Tax=Patella caerulea TaxID=87958 RepID=A0AAN8P772_PATCE
MAAPCRRLLGFVLIYLLFTSISAWDEGDFEVFDAVEEVNQNFYEFLGIGQDAKSSEIRKAYRKLSLQLHPDKNSAAEAESQFRNLVTVYDILRNEDKRQRYNRVLEDGLPDWRQPVFYYRRVRKMGLGELFLLLAGIFTLGQYLTAWSVYLEKKLVVQDVFEGKRKRELKKLKKMKGEGDVDDILQEEISAIPKPELINLWPILLVKFLYNFILTSPQRVVSIGRYLREKYEERRQQVVEEEEESEDDSNEGYERRPRKKPELPEYDPDFYCNSTAVSYTPVVSSQDTDNTQTKLVKKSDWCEEDTILLAKLVNKFPGGTPQRWEKIADMMGRPVEQVTARSKKAKEVYVANLTSVNKVDNVKLKGGNISKKGGGISDNIITKGEIIPSHETNTTTNQENIQSLDINSKKDVAEKKRRKNVNEEKVAERTKIITEYKTANKSNESESCNINQPDNSKSSKVIINESDTWTQNQQMILEWALRQYPKGTDLRWEKVSEHIPGKTKDDCILRFKYLADMVKKRKVTS